MSKEIIDLLEELANENNWGVRSTGFMSYMPKRDGKSCIEKPWKVANQALTLLKQQPTAREFTKECRKFADLTEERADYKGLSFAEYTYCLTVKLHEACNRLDRAESINKDLLEVCKGVRAWLDTSSLQQVLVHSTKDKRLDALIMGIASHLERLEAAIAKAKQ